MKLLTKQEQRLLKMTWQSVSHKKMMVSVQGWFLNKIPQNPQNKQMSSVIFCVHLRNVNST